MTMDLNELADRVEAAEGPDPVLDAEIHEALFGIVNAAPVGVTYRDPFDRLSGYSHPFRFTSNVADAENALPGPEWPEWQITRRFCTGYHANVGLGVDGPGCINAACALTSAALRARTKALGAIHTLTEGN